MITDLYQLMDKIVYKWSRYHLTSNSSSLCACYLNRLCLAWVWNGSPFLSAAISLQITHWPTK